MSEETADGTSIPDFTIAQKFCRKFIQFSSFFNPLKMDFFTFSMHYKSGIIYAIFCNDIYQSKSKDKTLIPAWIKIPKGMTNVNFFPI
jgi:hypothetical protein